MKSREGKSKEPSQNNGSSCSGEILKCQNCTLEEKKDRKCYGFRQKPIRKRGKIHQQKRATTRRTILFFSPKNSNKINKIWKGLDEKFQWEKEGKCQNVQLWTMAQQSVCNPKIDTEKSGGTQIPVVSGEPNSARFRHSANVNGDKEGGNQENEINNISFDLKRNKTTSLITLEIVNKNIWKNKIKTIHLHTLGRRWSVSLRATNCSSPSLIFSSISRWSITNLAFIVTKWL